MFPTIMYVLHLEKHKMQNIKNQNINTKKIGLRKFTRTGNPGFKGKGKFPYIGVRGTFPLHKGS